MRVLVVYDTVYGSTGQIDGWIAERDAAKAQVTELESELAAARGKEAAPETCPEPVEGSGNLPRPKNIRVGDSNHLTTREARHAKTQRIYAQEKNRACSAD